jgi:hypothetical protein
MKRTGWLAVDIDGLGALRENSDPATIIYEAVQNAWDEPITKVDVDLLFAGQGHATLMVEDNSPAGFADLADSYTMFAPSKKKGNAEKRGRFNLGEKLILALAEEAIIRSTKGTVHFHKNGTRTFDKANPRSSGTLLTAYLRLKRKQVEDAVAGAHRLIPPPGIETRINNQLLMRPKVVRAFEVKALPTVMQTEEGFRETARNTHVEVYEPRDGERACIYELGIPVVETGDRWHVNVLQKVPLNMDRDNVTPAYLRRLRTEVANAMADLITGDDATETWAKEALSDERITPEATQTIIKQRFGDKAVAFDPSDVEGSKLAVAQGYTVVYPRMLGKGEWANVREKTPELLRPAGQVTPSNSTITFGLSGKSPIDPAKWTEGMSRVAMYAAQMHTAIFGVRCLVSFYVDPTGDPAWAAAYSRDHLSFNLGRLGHAWFMRHDPVTVDQYLIHEFAHRETGDHLSDDFADECCRLGAVMRSLCATLPTI